KGWAMPWGPAERATSQDIAERHTPTKGWNADRAVQTAPHAVKFHILISPNGMCRPLRVTRSGVDRSRRFSCTVMSACVCASARIMLGLSHQRVFNLVPGCGLNGGPMVSLIMPSQRDAGAVARRPGLAGLRRRPHLDRLSVRRRSTIIRVSNDR